MAITQAGEININLLFNGQEGGNPSTNGENGNPSAPVNMGQPNADNPASAGSDAVSLSAAVNVAMSLGKQAVGAAVSNIGLATGNNYAQDRISKFVSAIGMAGGLLAASSNPITFITSVGSLLISGLSQSYRTETERMWENRRARQYAILYGFASDDGR